MQARSTMWPIKETRESGGAQTVAITRVPNGSPPTICSALDSMRFKSSVSVYKKVKKKIAHVPKPASCHLLGFREPIRQSPNMAVIAVSREASNPIQPPEIDGRRFSGSRATATMAMKYNSAGSRKDGQKEGSRQRETKSTATQSTPKASAIHPSTA